MDILAMIFVLTFVLVVGYLLGTWRTNKSWEEFWINHRLRTNEIIKHDLKVNQ